MTDRTRAEHRTSILPAIFCPPKRIAKHPQATRSGKGEWRTRNGASNQCLTMRAAREYTAHVTLQSTTTLRTDLAGPANNLDPVFTPFSHRIPNISGQTVCDTRETCTTIVGFHTTVVKPVPHEPFPPCSTASPLDPCGPSENHAGVPRTCGGHPRDSSTANSMPAAADAAVRLVYAAECVAVQNILFAPVLS